MKKILVITTFLFIPLFTVPCFAQGPVFLGMTENGGSLNKGAIISFNPATNTEDTVHSFGQGKDGYNPSGSFVFDANNSLFYGMTFLGGSLGEGAIISFNPFTNTEDTVHSFGQGLDGTNPDGNNLTYDANNGLFYAMTYGGGSLGEGTIIKFNPNTHAEDTVHSFGRGLDGTSPAGSLVYYSGNGLFYGMTNQGGSLNKGAIISFNSITNIEDTVHSFGRGKDGVYPITSLVYDAGNGLFYGMTYGGGSLGEGAIISFNPITNAEDTVHSFGRGADGAVPDGNNLVYYAANGLFYGMIYSGGSLGKGAIISFNPTTNVEDTVHSFGRGKDGVHPMNDLIYYPNTGLFYGMTNAGGSLGKGAIISFNPTTNAEDTVHSFGRGLDGTSPHFSNLILYTPPLLSINQVKADEGIVKVFPNPSNGVFTIVIASEAKPVRTVQPGGQSQHKFEIYNVLGEQVYSQFSTFNSQLSINLSNQPNGIYLYRVVGENEELIGEGKLVIER